MNPCYFGACGSKRSDALRDHCERKHASGPDVVAAGKNAVGYTFHFLDGHTDRVWATCRGKESPSSVGHCFLCHTFFKKDGYKTIEDATAAHVCNPTLGKERAKRGPKLSAAAAAAVGGAGIATGPVVMVTEQFLRDKYVEGRKAFEYPYREDCSIDVVAAVDVVFEKAFMVPRLIAEKTQYAKELTDLRTSNVAGPMDTSTVLSMLKMDSRLAAFVTQQETLKREAASKPSEFDEDEELVPYNPFDVIKQFAYDAKKLSVVERRHETICAAKDAKTIALEGELAQASQQIFRHQQDIISYQKDVVSLNHALREYETEIKRLHAELNRKSAVDVAPADPVSAPPVAEAPPADCKSESAPHLLVEEC